MPEQSPNSHVSVGEALHKYGSDKVSDHSYGLVYDSLIGSKADQIRSLLEIGILGGSSLQAWLAAMPQAVIFGVDINFPPSGLVGPRCRTAQCDATEPASLLRCLFDFGISPFSLDIIIDDASHTYRDQVATLMLLWDYLRPGGLYFIEDVQPTTPHAPFVRLGGTIYDLRHVKGRADDVMIVFVKPMP